MKHSLINSIDIYILHVPWYYLVRFLSLADASKIQNFDVGVDAFDEKSKGSQKKVHIRVQQRTGRKNITTVQGLDDDLDLKRILKAIKKRFACNGAIVRHKELGEVLQLQGDQCENVKDWLYEQEIYNRSEGRIVVHGH